VVGSQRLRLWLWNRARSFVFSTGVSPTLASAIRERASRAAGDDAGRGRLMATAHQLRSELVARGVASDGRGPVIPWVVGEPGAAVALSRRLREQGVLVQAIRPPTVPAGTARLRITATARLGETDIDRALQAFRAVL
jgi:8-amino-7-oxononanoate synthase